MNAISLCHRAALRCSVVLSVTIGLVFLGASTMPTTAFAQKKSTSGDVSDNDGPLEGGRGKANSRKGGPGGGSQGDRNGKGGPGNRTGGPGGGQSGGPGGGGPSGGRATSYTLGGEYTLSGKTEKSEKKTYTSDKKDVSAIYVKDGGDLTLIDPTISTTGDSSNTENSSFYGLNAAVLVTKGSKATISGGTITSTGSGANGVFAAGKGAEISLTNVKIKASGGGGHGVMATQGGKLTLKDVDIVTMRERAGAIATDRGSGSIKATGGNVVTYGNGSPGIYSTGDISATGTKFDAVGAEAAVIEGSNSITLDSCSLLARKKCGAMIYQSFSGDAEGRKGVFTMKGGSFSAKDGPLFFVNNTTAVITLREVDVTADSGVIVNAAPGRWGRSGSNGGHVTFTAEKQVLKGDFTCDSISSLLLTLQEKSTLTGTIRGGSLKIDAGSVWNVTADSTLAGLTDEMEIAGETIKNIHGNGHTVEYDASLPANKWLKNKTYKLADGGTLTPKKSLEK